MAAPKVDAPENTSAPETPRTIDGVKLYDGPQRDKAGTFLKAAYPVGNGVYRVDRGTKV